MKNTIISSGICTINALQTHLENFDTQLEVWSSGNLEDFEKKIDNQEYYFIILDKRFESDKNMSKVFGNQKKNIIKIINDKYKLQKEDLTDTFGLVKIYSK